jgi:hypothetical protein
MDDNLSKSYDLISFFKKFYWIIILCVIAIIVIVIVVIVTKKKTVNNNNNNLYSCDTNGNCNSGCTGNNCYKNSNCDNKCSPINPPLSGWSCDTSNYTCNQDCAPSSVEKYKAGDSCYSTQSACQNNCTAPLSGWSCDTSTYTCKQDCTASSVEKYKAGDSCYSTQSACQNNCTAPLPPPSFENPICKYDSVNKKWFIQVAGNPGDTLISPNSAWCNDGQGNLRSYSSMNDCNQAIADSSLICTPAIIYNPDTNAEFSPQIPTCEYEPNSQAFLPIVGGTLNNPICCSEDGMNCAWSNTDVTCFNYMSTPGNCSNNSKGGYKNDPTKPLSLSNQICTNDTGNWYRQVAGNPGDPWGTKGSGCCSLDGVNCYWYASGSDCNQALGEPSIPCRALVNK